MSWGDDMAKTLIDELYEASDHVVSAIFAYHQFQLAECERRIHSAKTVIESAERTLELAWGNRPGGPGHHG
jgi:hypothetical protein